MQCQVSLKSHKTRLRNRVHEFEWINVMVLQCIPFSGRQEEDTGSRNTEVFHQLTAYFYLNTPVSHELIYIDEKLTEADCDAS